MEMPRYFPWGYLGDSAKTEIGPQSNTLLKDDKPPLYPPSRHQVVHVHIQRTSQPCWIHKDWYRWRVVAPDGEIHIVEKSNIPSY